MTLAPDPALLEVSPEGVAMVTLNRPDKRNAFDELMIANLAEHFETLKGAEHVRIVFVRGSTFRVVEFPDGTKHLFETVPGSSNQRARPSGLTVGQT